jgi:hypothetical protein
VVPVHPGSWLGAYPAHTIKQAHDRHEELRALVERGESPAKTKLASVAARKVAESRDLTVRVFARRWIELGTRPKIL